MNTEPLDARDRTARRLWIHGGDYVSARSAAEAAGFVARRGGANWHAAEKTRAALWRPLRPTGNVLAGYSQSVHLATAQEAA